MQNQETGSRAPKCRGGLRIHTAWQRSSGFGLIGWIIVIPLVVVLLMIVAIGFCEGRKAYWDFKVREMCAKDGGTRVHERVTLTKTEYDRLGGRGGMIAVPHEKSASKDYPYISTGSTMIINENDPRVYRSEDIYVRRSDRKILATSVQYSRVGGDFPLSYAHPSSFVCPEQKKVVAEERAIFNVDGFAK